MTLRIDYNLEYKGYSIIIWVYIIQMAVDRNCLAAFGGRYITLLYFLEIPHFRFNQGTYYAGRKELICPYVLASY